jgi:hypothetical protein
MCSDASCQPPTCRAHCTVCAHACGEFCKAASLACFHTCNPVVMQTNSQRRPPGQGNSATSAPLASPHQTAPFTVHLFQAPSCQVQAAPLHFQAASARDPRSVRLEKELELHRLALRAQLQQVINSWFLCIITNLSWPSCFKHSCRKAAEAHSQF